MTAFESSAAWLLTYLIHSTILLSVVWGIVRLKRSVRPEVRDRLWKGALLGGIATSLFQQLAPAAHLGFEWRLAQRETPNSVAVNEAPQTPIHTHESPNRRPVSIPDASASPVEETVDLAETAPTTASTASVSIESVASGFHWPTTILWSWLLVAGFMLLRLGWRCLQLNLLIRSACDLGSPRACEMVKRIQQKIGLSGRIDILVSPRCDSPMAVGVFRRRIVLPPGLLKVLDREQARAMLAHELAHFYRRDPLWSLICEIASAVFVVQPLNRVAQKAIRQEAEFLADSAAADALRNQLGIARCLATLAAWLAERTKHHSAPLPAAAAMAGFNSTLGKRIEQVLRHDRHSARSPRGLRVASAAVVMVMLGAVLWAGPRISNHPVNSKFSNVESPPMKSSLSKVLVAGTLLTAPLAAEEKKPTEKPSAKTTQKVVKVPEGMRGISGMLVGKVVKTDTEKGVLVFQLAQVKRLWKKNKAKNPKSGIGKVLQVNRISGKFLDNLLTLKPGDGVQIEVFHTKGDHLTFLGEMLKKVPLVKAVDEPNAKSTLQPGVRGFNGQVRGVVVKKNTNGTITFKVARITRVWKRANRAKDPEKLIKMSIVVGPHTSKRDDGKRRVETTQVKFIAKLKARQELTINVKHASGDRFEITELNREQRAFATGEKVRRREDEKPDGKGERSDIQGFRGALSGDVVSVDAEKGQLTFRVKKVLRVWKKSRARKPKSLEGKTMTLEGVSGKFIDVLISLKKGDAVELGAFHRRDDRLTFPGELLRKAK